MSARETDPRVLLELDAVHLRRGRRQVLHGVDLTVREHDITVVLGPNGAGKSSLLEAVGGLLPTASGTLRTHGRVATVLQTPGLARRSVRANVELALRWWGVPRRERGTRAMEALELMSATHLAPRAAGSLSGGERRRVHVARGLALRPDLLLLDEPFAGLDSQTRAQLCRDTASALRANARGVLLVVHEREEALALATRLVVMADGRVVAAGDPIDVLEHPPTPEVARFLGYDGQLTTSSGVLLTRPTHVRPDPRGAHQGVVRRTTLSEVGHRVDLATPDGHVTALTHQWAAAVGQTVRFDVVGGAEFAAEPASGG